MSAVLLMDEAMVNPVGRMLATIVHNSSTRSTGVVVVQRIVLSVFVVLGFFWKWHALLVFLL